jgi:hypothetical protein
MITIAIDAEEPVGREMRRSLSAEWARREHDTGRDTQKRRLVPVEMDDGQFTWISLNFYSH